MTRRMAWVLSSNQMCHSAISDVMAGARVGVGEKVIGELDEAVATWRRLPSRAPYCMWWAWCTSASSCQVACRRIELNSQFSGLEEPIPAISKETWLTRGTDVSLGSREVRSGLHEVRASTSVHPELFAGSGTDPCNGRCSCCRVAATGPLQFSPVAPRLPWELEGHHKSTPTAWGGLLRLRKKTIEHLGILLAQQKGTRTDTRKSENRRSKRLCATKVWGIVELER